MVWEALLACSAAVCKREADVREADVREAGVKGRWKRCENGRDV